MRRVAVTGLGVVSSIGIGKDQFWDCALRGCCGTSEVASMDTSSFDNHRGGEVKSLEPGKFLPGIEFSALERGSILAMVAAKLSLEDSAVDLRKNSRPIGISMGTTLGEVTALEKADDAWIRGSPLREQAAHFRRYACNNIPANVARHLGLRGANIMIPNACAAGNFAIGYAFDLIRSGKADAMLAGGADPFSRVTFTGFNRLGAVSPDVVRSFDEASVGMMVGEGAAMLFLEPLEQARERNARIYAEVMGYGVSCDANHMTAPHPESRGMIQAMSQALRVSNLAPEQIDMVIAHGTGTPANDKAENDALAKIFNGHLGSVPVTSIKSMIGHSMGAASAIEALTNALAVYHRKIPPTANHRKLRTGFSIDVVCGTYREKCIRFGMNNALAFGGNNSSLILGAFGDGMPS